MPSGSEIRSTFLRFFESKQHRRVHSSSLVPANDPTLLFTNAGMNQFKDVFLGLEHRDYRRATTSQKCVRAGGKHNDLENVGFTTRHHTFFEMLGNFSFGDYFKRDAIAFAWELITSPEWFAVSPDKLYVTIFAGENGVPRDDDAERFWLEVGVPQSRIFGLGAKENFWQMGDTGPCGPCSEIHYDMGVAASDKKDPKCAAGECQFPCECGRYVEFWHLVFMQFNRQAIGGATGEVQYSLEPLPAPSVDTGMGLERIASILQGVVSNYETDLFVPLMQRAAQLCGVDYAKETSAENQSRSAASLRVIADHARATTFLIGDGVLPANEGRGYVLRKIMRRAIRHGRLLGQNKPFLSQMVFAVRDLMNDAYPELNESADRVAKVVLAEEERFARTLELGLKRLDDLIAANELTGGESFKLYDTFLDHTPFYADSGGQVGDHGWFYSDNRNTLVAQVHGCVLPVQGVRAHRVTAKQHVTVGDKVEAVVDADFRLETMRNHTGTHLVHAALREVLGTHVKQAGSLVDPQHLRFDFSHFTGVSDEEMQDIDRKSTRLNSSH